MKLHADKAEQDDQAVLTKAVLRAAEHLELEQRELAAVLGVSSASLSRMVKGERLIPRSGSEWERALYFLRVFRSLDSLVGGDRVKATAWLRASNTHLDGVPAEVMKKDFGGLFRVAEYLDALRGTY